MCVSVPPDFTSQRTVRGDEVPEILWTFHLHLVVLLQSLHSNEDYGHLDWHAPGSRVCILKITVCSSFFTAAPPVNNMACWECVSEPDKFTEIRGQMHHGPQRCVLLEMLESGWRYSDLCNISRYKKLAVDMAFQ